MQKEFARCARSCSNAKGIRAPERAHALLTTRGRSRLISFGSIAKGIPRFARDAQPLQGNRARHARDCSVYYKKARSLRSRAKPPRGFCVVVLGLHLAVSSWPCALPCRSFGPLRPPASFRASRLRSSELAVALDSDLALTRTSVVPPCLRFRSVLRVAAALPSLRCCCGPTPPPNQGGPHLHFIQMLQRLRETFPEYPAHFIRSGKTFSRPSSFHSEGNLCIPPVWVERTHLSNTPTQRGKRNGRSNP